MRTADIKVGARYAARIKAKHVETVAGQDYAKLREKNPFFSFDMSAVKLPYHFDSYEVEVLEIERTAKNRPVIRVEGQMKHLAVEIRREEHLDGTYTEWKGVRHDENGDAIYDILPFEALVPPGALQSLQEALIYSEMFKMKTDLLKVERGWGGKTYADLGVRRDIDDDDDES